jgi:hypothetical protein
MSFKSLNDEEMQEIKNACVELAAKFAERGISPFAIAACLAQTSFMMYKSMLNEEEYNTMIDYVSESRHRVQSLDEIKEQSKLSLN